MLTRLEERNAGRNSTIAPSGERQFVVASRVGAALLDTLDLTIGVSNWIVVDYCTRYGRLLAARRLAGMFSDSQKKTMIDLRGMCQDLDIGVWDYRLSLVRQRCAGTINPTGPFDMPCILHGDRVAYVRHLYVLFRRYREKSTEEK